MLILIIILLCAFTIYQRHKIIKLEIGYSVVLDEAEKEVVIHAQEIENRKALLIKELKEAQQTHSENLKLGQAYLEQLTVVSNLSKEDALKMITEYRHFFKINSEGEKSWY